MRRFLTFSAAAAPSGGVLFPVMHAGRICIRNNSGTAKISLKMAVLMY